MDNMNYNEWMMNMHYKVQSQLKVSNRIGGFLTFVGGLGCLVTLVDVPNMAYMEMFIRLIFPWGLIGLFGNWIKDKAGPWIVKAINDVDFEYKDKQVLNLCPHMQTIDNRPQFQQQNSMQQQSNIVQQQQTATYQNNSQLDNSVVNQQNQTQAVETTVETTTYQPFDTTPKDLWGN